MPSASSTAEPTDAAAVPSAPAEPPIASIEPSATPTATAAAELAIASGIEVVGESAAFSPDGTWFAFTARPADRLRVARMSTPGGSGDEQALPVTDDGVVVLRLVGGDELIVEPTRRRIGARSPTPMSVAIDPANGDETDAGDALAAGGRSDRQAGDRLGSGR